MAPGGFHALIWRMDRAVASNPAAQVDLDLARSLRRFSREAGKDDAAADEAYLNIQSAIDDLQRRKLRDRRQRLAKKKAGPRQDDTADNLARLVRLKSYELRIGQPRRSKDKAQQLVIRDFPLDEQARRVIWNESDLRPAEKRAREIIRGAQRNAKKNPIESDAIALADAVIAEWFTPATRSRGRPAGTRIPLAQQTIQHDPKLTSVIEVIEAILPIIEQIAGPKISSSPRSIMIRTVAAAVRSAALTCPLELAASAVQKLRRLGGAAKR